MGIGFDRRKIRLGDLFVAAGAITDNELKQAIAYQKEHGLKLGQALVETGLISKELLNATLTQQLGIEYIELLQCKLDDSITRLISENLVVQYRVIPLGFDEYNPNVLKIATSDPMNLDALDTIQIATGYQVEPMLADDDDIQKMIDRYYSNQQAMEVAERYRAEMMENGINEEDEKQLDDEVENSPIVLLVKQIMENGVKQRASDIHIEPLESKVRVRYRIDGVLKEVMTYDYSLLPAISARIKIIGGMDIAEKRKPQDGRITIMVDRREFDVRVSILPTVYGEKTVMRLTSKEGLTKPKSGLGLSPEDLVKFDGILSNPHGIILVTGPTGSGKSTTLYTSLSELNQEDVNIITVEDPVEANINGINQVQVNNKAGLTFASALRSILRQDPDIIMIGEIRDNETAEIAVTASITGHLVVSTLHTNSAASAITRLEDMGLESYLLGDAVCGVIAQRLVRRLCTCKVAREAEPEEKKALGYPVDQPLTINFPGGCPVCNGTGYAGRIGVYEIMPISHGIKRIIGKGGNADQIEDVALSEGMKTLRMSASELVIKGVTSISEMYKIVYDTSDFIEEANVEEETEESAAK